MSEEHDYLVYHAIQTPDGTILESTHRHDYRTHTDSIAGETYMIDGGIDYRRGSINKVPAKDLSVYISDGHEKVREVVLWGTYGKNGDQPFKRIKLMDMETEHIKACLSTQRMHPGYLAAFNDELMYRGEK